MGTPEFPQHLSGEEITKALTHGIESGEIVIPEPGGPTYSVQEVADELGIEWPPTTEQ